MHYGKLILIVVGLLISIHSNGQTTSNKPPCDSSINICPVTFDFFIKQAVLAKMYYTDKINLTAEVSSLKSQLLESNNLNTSTSELLLNANASMQLVQKSLDLKITKIKGLESQNKWLKFGCVALGVTGIATTIYVAVKK